MCQQNHKRDSIAIQHLKTEAPKAISLTPERHFSRSSHWLVEYVFLIKPEARWVPSCVSAMLQHQPFLSFLLPSAFTWKNFQLADLLLSLLKNKRLLKWCFGSMQAKPHFPNRNIWGGQSPRISACFTFQFMSWHPTRTASNISLVTNENLGILLMIYRDAFFNMKLQRTSLPGKREMTDTSIDGS